MIFFMSAFLDGADVAVDALGGLVDRPALAAAARERHIPLVTAAVAGYTVIVATVLPGDPSPVELLAGGTAGPSAEEVLGCPSPAVMAASALQGTEVVRLLAGRKPALAGKALVIDLEAMLPRKPDHKMVYLASFSYLADLETLGVKFYRYSNGFLHQKVILVDDVMPPSIRNRTIARPYLYPPAM